MPMVWLSERGDAMATITFEPPATETQWRSICAMFGTCEPHWVVDTDNHDEHETRVVASVTTNSWPCDVTIYPGSPNTWARAVYEAGVKAGRREGVPLGPGKPHGPSPAYRDPGDSLLDLDARLRSVGGYSRERVTAVDARIESLVVNGVEYRPVNP